VRRGAILVALMLELAAPAFAQDVPAPRTDVAALRKEAKADIAIRKALGDASRTMESLLRDNRRMVELILRAGAAKPGDRVLDVASGGGYLALLFAAMVGKTGHVDIHNTPGWIAQFPSMEVERQQAIIKQVNVGWITQPWNDLDAPADSYDLIVLGQVYHDVILESGDYEGLNRRLFAMLKPGGRVVVEDHDANELMYLGEQVDLHRISHGDVTGHFLKAGFAQTEMVLIDSTFDDRKFNVFWPTVRGRTDRFIAVFEKPLDGKPLR
jgi:predicted methyltransferase